MTLSCHMLMMSLVDDNVLNSNKSRKLEAKAQK